jgi:membrane associated rhomboid family serine protease
MIPIRDRFYKRTQPIVNYWLMGINIAIFFWELKLELGGELGNFVNSWGLIPAQFTAGVQNALFVNPAAWIIVFRGVVSLFTGMFIHASFSQILGNLLFLWVFGQTIENLIGHKRYLGLYLAAGVLTGIAQIFMEPQLTVPCVGANGAIAAMIGAYMIKFPQAKIDSVLPLLLIYIPIELPAIFYLFWWFVQQLFYGVGSLHIPPSGANLSSMAYGMQIIGLVVGATYIRHFQPRM